MQIVHALGADLENGCLPEPQHHDNDEDGDGDKNKELHRHVLRRLGLR